MTRITRRGFAQLSGAGALAAGTGGLAGILASGRAPAYAQTQTMHWLRWADFVPASDQLLKGEIAKQCEKDLGMKLTVETINANDIQARITAAIQSGAGPDIFMALNNWPQLYADSCVDVSDVAEDLGKAQGGFYDICKVVGTVDGKWIGVPWCTGGGLVAYRKSWLAEAGAKEFPKNWDDFRTVGKKLKAAGHPYGQTAGHTFGDAPGWWYPYLWSWGGKEVEADGKTVVLNTKETVESVKFAVALWKETMDEGGLAWDDTQQQPRLPVRQHQRHEQRCLDLSRGEEEARLLPDREGHADEGRHPSRRHSRRRRRPVQPAGPANPPGDEVLEEPGRGQEVPPLGIVEGNLREVVHLAAGLYLRRDQGVGGPSGVERRPGPRPVQEDPGHRAPDRAMPENRTRKQPRCRPSTSSSTCTRRRSRAWRAEESVKAAHDELVKIYGA